MDELHVSAALISQDDAKFLKDLLRRGPVTLALNWSSALPQATVVRGAAWACMPCMSCGLRSWGYVRPQHLHHDSQWVHTVVCHARHLMRRPRPALPVLTQVELEWWTNSNDECGTLCDDQTRFIKVRAQRVAIWCHACMHGTPLPTRVHA